MKSDPEDKKLIHFFAGLKQEDENLTPAFKNLLPDSLQDDVTRSTIFFNKRFALAAILALSIVGSLFIVIKDKSTEEKTLSQWCSPTNSLLQSNPEWHWRSIEHPGAQLSNWSSPTASLAKLRKAGKYNSVPGLGKSRNNNYRNL